MVNIYFKKGEEMNLSERFKQERNRLELSQESTANKCNVVLATQFKYEKDKSSPSVDYWQKLTIAGFDIGYILTGKKTPNIEKIIEMLKSQEKPKPVISFGGSALPKAKEADYGIRLKQQRLEKNLSQTAVAEIGNTSKTTQLSYEKGRTSPPNSYWQSLNENGFDLIYIITGVLIQTVSEHLEWREENKVTTGAPPPSYDDLKAQNGMLRKLLQESLKQIEESLEKTRSQKNELKNVLNFLDR